MCRRPAACEGLTPTIPNDSSSVRPEKGFHVFKVLFFFFFHESHARFRLDQRDRPRDTLFAFPSLTTTTLFAIRSWPAILKWRPDVYWA